MSAQALADGADLTATLLSRRRLPSTGARFALLMAGGSAAVAAASALMLAAAARADADTGAAIAASGDVRPAGPDPAPQ
jgi:hypothetical protein